MGRVCSTKGGLKRNACRILMGKPEGKRPLLGEIGWAGMDWID
jgi:hypothetical protein